MNQLYDQYQALNDSQIKRAQRAYVFRLATKTGLSVQTVRDELTIIGESLHKELKI